MRIRPASAPLVTAALVAANVLAYGFERDAVAAGADPCRTYGLVPAHFAIGPVFTSMFLHDPSNLLHIVGNALFLAAFGARVERVLGAVRFALLYFAAGIGGAAVHVLVDPSATIPMVGASGAIWGVLAAAAMLYGRSTLAFIAVFFCTNLWYAFTGTGEEIAFGAHIGGFAVGYLMLRLVFARTLAKVRYATAH